jgi:hypothetical protein
MRFLLDVIRCQWRLLCFCPMLQPGETSSAEHRVSIGRQPRILIIVARCPIPIPPSLLMLLGIVTCRAQQITCVPPWSRLFWERTAPANQTILLKDRWIGSDSHRESLITSSPAHADEGSEEDFPSHNPEADSRGQERRTPTVLASGFWKCSGRGDPMHRNGFSVVRNSLHT